MTTHNKQLTMLKGVKMKMDLKLDDYSENQMTMCLKGVRKKKQDG